MDSSGIRKISERNIGIDNIKALGIIIIVLFHSVQSLAFLSWAPNYIMSTTDFPVFLLMIVSGFGVLGNNIFFVCSANFLVDSKRVKYQKTIQMIMDVWVISVVILVIHLLVPNNKLEGQNILSFLFPSLFANNWYITCYILFYLIHPYLNIIINHLSRRQLLRLVVLLCGLYLGVNYIVCDSLYANNLVVWITIYFLIGYLKRYKKELFDSRRTNFIILFISIIGQIGILGIANILGLYFPPLADKVLHWNSYYSPLIMMIALTLFNLF